MNREGPPQYTARAGVREHDRSPKPGHRPLFRRSPYEPPADRDHRWRRRHRNYSGDRHSWVGARYGFGFGDKVTGDDTGYDRGTCTLFGKHQALCTVVLKLSKGTLNLEAITPSHNNKTPWAITGGTGAYNGARGTALVTDVTSNTSDIQITLLP